MKRREFIVLSLTSAVVRGNAVALAANKVPRIG